MTVTMLDSNQARNKWREMLDKVLINKTDVVITRYNKPVATVVAYEDYLIIQDELTKRRAEREALNRIDTSALATMVASEQVLARDWNSPEEDEAWANL
ncbi:MAG TPA: type II toxin-antitoxin system Phd/YefM family antitoxin [Caldilineae bacterium]|nr:type II toxin-antitoxin system Phd/YefM family antitoxin [Caldilineae bacterium]